MRLVLYLSRAERARGSREGASPSLLPRLLKLVSNDFINAQFSRKCMAEPV
jgi:hypothetical protein